MIQQVAAPPLPGAVGVTHLKVYDTQAPDGQIGGSPHLHFACTEAYMVLAGRGAVQTLGADGFKELPLDPGRLVWFTPGLIHRLINLDGRLEILVLMQNAGLPEAGDFVLTFPPEVLADQRAYFDAASLAPSGAVYTNSQAAARRRRDLAVDGFAVLRERFEQRGAAALEEFYRAALRLVEPKIGAWAEVWERGPLAAARQTGEQLDALRHGRVDHLLDGAIYGLPAPDEPRRLGVCGTLGVYLPEGVLNMILRTIHVGVGARGAWPIEVMGTDPKFQPVALVDVNRDFLAVAQAKLKLPDAGLFGDLQAALGAVEADAVVICTPTVTHAPLARLAFSQGKHVLVEKGMTMDWAEAQALVREAEQAGVKFCVAQNYRYFANMATIKRLLEAPDQPHHPGAVQIVDFIHHRYRPEPRTLNYPYAMVWDMSCHHVDLLAFWLGEARRVTALSYNSSWSQYAHDANIAAIVEYAGGAVCHYVLTHSATISDWRIILQGERGALRTGDVPGVQFFPRPSGQLGWSQPLACDEILLPASEQGVADDFYRFVAERVEPGISGRNNLQTLAVCEMLVRSARDRRPVERAELG